MSLKEYSFKIAFLGYGLPQIFKLCALEILLLGFFLYAFFIIPKDPAIP